MTYSPGLTSGFAATKMRSNMVSPHSGMCSMCTADCKNQCEIGLAAVLGAQTVYPLTTGDNQIASEKDLPFDYSHFNINGRCFGITGLKEGLEPSIYNVSLEGCYGSDYEVKTLLPIVLPALIKLNWKDYFAGAAMAGVTCMVGENAVYKDSNLVLKDGKVDSMPMLQEIHDAFYDYYRGYGQMVIQCDWEDLMLGVHIAALQKYGFEAVEIKFGQAAKGTQPTSRVGSLEEARKKKLLGLDVYPDPDDPEIAKAYEAGKGMQFFAYNRLPIWTEESLADMISELRDAGAKNVYFKMAGYDKQDIKEVLRIASKYRVDMVTFDGAGGGSGYSPNKMMNEWGLPAIMIEPIICEYVSELKKDEAFVPAIVITGGFASEDQIFKALALGDGKISYVGVCRAAMAAAMKGKEVGERIANGQVPAEYQKFGTTIEEIFADMNELKGIYDCEAEDLPTGAVGVYSYLKKLAFGVKHFAALNRKFDINYVNQDDLIPLTELAFKLLK